MERVDIAIIGAGPAGMTAGIYAKRKHLKTRVFEKNLVGGHTLEAVLIENYPGFKSIKGYELAQKMQKHLESLGIKIEEGIEVKSARKKSKLFELELSTGETLEAHSIIIATGTSYRKLKAKNAEKFEGKGIHFCATCDGPLFKNKTVAVVGGGNSGVTNALFLAEICRKVYLIEFNEKLKADEIYHEQLKKAGIQVICNAEVFEVLGETMVEGIKYRDRSTSQENELKLGGVFVYIGLKPNSELALQLGCKLTPRGYVKVDNGMQTSIQGVFGAGDVTGMFAQTIVAAGQGATAAEAAYWYLKNKKIQ